MNRAHNCALAWVILLTMFLTPDAHAMEIHWPGAFEQGELPVLYAETVLGPPDGRVAEFAGTNSSATFFDFTGGVDLAPENLAALLGVDTGLVMLADVIAFEAWGTSFELSGWTFAGGPSALSLDMPDQALASSTLTTEAYTEFFGIAPDDGEGPWQFVLIDLGDWTCPLADLRVTVQRGYGPYGSPDLDAIGILVDGTVASEPTTWSGVKALFR
jgi:hypothetical protein|nr:hypothetical protein [Candidatus Krumholzibacteria bacterium]